MNPTLDRDFWLRLFGILVLETGLIVAFAFAVQMVVRPAFWRRAIWQIAFVSLFLTVGAEMTGLGRGLSVWLAGKPVPERKMTVRLLPVEEQFIPMPYEAEMPEPLFIPQPEKPVAHSVWWPGILWIAGCGLIVARILSARMFLTLLRWRKPRVTEAILLNRVAELAQRLGLRRKIRLLEAPGLTGPMTFGIVWPTIGLPAGFEQKFTPVQQDAMLTHELAHLAARDPFWYLLADVVAAPLWWQPLVWWARRRLHSASEHAADEAAVLLENGPGTLAECLVHLGQQMTPVRSFGWLGAGGSGFRSHLGQRVERLLKMGPARHRAGGWKSVFLKMCATIFLASVVIMTSGWIQKGDAQRPPNWRSALQQSWDGSFASRTMMALAETRIGETTAVASLKTTGSELPDENETISFDAVFYEAIPVTQMKSRLGRALDTEDGEGLVILTQKQLRRVLTVFTDLPHTYDFVGSKFSGGRFLYQGSATNQTGCTYLTKVEKGVKHVEGAQMVYGTTNQWSFWFVPKKLEKSIQFKLEWPNGSEEIAPFEMPSDGGAILSRIDPQDPTRQQLILFSSIHVLPQTEVEKETEESVKRKVAAAILVQDGKLLFEMGKLVEAEAKLNSARQQDPENTAVFYYNNLIKETRYKRASQTREQEAKEALVAVQRARNPSSDTNALPIPKLTLAQILFIRLKAEKEILQDWIKFDCRKWNLKGCHSAKF